MAALQTNDAVQGGPYTVLKFQDVKALICQAVGGEAALKAEVRDKLNEGVANAVSIRTEFIAKPKTVPDIPFSKFKFSIMSGKRFCGEFKPIADGRACARGPEKTITNPN